MAEKNFIKYWILLLFAISFCFCIFAPLEIFFSNKSEFWFHLGHLLPIVILVFVSVFVVLTLITIPLSMTKVAVDIYSFLIFLMLYFYIQGNFIPRNYGVLDGSEIDWGRYKVYGFLSVCLIVLFLSIWFVYNFVLKKFKHLTYKFGKVICLFLISIQVITIGILYLQNDVFQKSSDVNLVVTSDKIFEVSKENNVIIILLDTFDATDMNNILIGENFEFVNTVLQNFIYYPDTVGMYPTTKAALPHILTGIKYKNEEPYEYYIQKAYEKTHLYRELVEKDYSVGVYTSSEYLNQNYSIYENLVQSKYKIKIPLGFMKKIYTMVMFNYVPHQLKKNFIVFDNEFLKFRETEKHLPLFSADTQKFYRTLTDSTLNIGNNENVFRFYHLAGIHKPYTFGKDLQTKKEKYTVTDEALGCMTLLSVFFNKLKEKDVYDSSTIIIMADHGHYKFSQNPLFLVKNKNELHPLFISSAKMSYDYLQDLLVSLIKYEMPISENEIMTIAAKNTERQFLFYNWDNFWARLYLPTIKEMITKGFASNEDEFVFTGNRFDASKYEEYKIGKILSFAKQDGATARKYCVNGFSASGKEYTWSDGFEAEIRMRLKGSFKNIVLDMDYFTYNGTKSVYIYANENKIAEYIADGSEQKSFVISGSFIGEDRQLVLKFLLPDAISPLSRGVSDDDRNLSLGFRKIRLSSTSRPFDLGVQEF